MSACSGTSGIGGWPADSAPNLASEKSSAMPAMPPSALIDADGDPFQLLATADMLPWSSVLHRLADTEFDGTPCVLAWHSAELRFFVVHSCCMLYALMQLVPLALNHVVQGSYGHFLTLVALCVLWPLQSRHR